MLWARRKTPVAREPMLSSFVSKPKINTSKTREIFLEIKLSVKWSKGQMKKKKVQSLCIQIHISAQLFYSLPSNADYLVPDPVPSELATVSAYTHPHFSCSSHWPHLASRPYCCAFQVVHFQSFYNASYWPFLKSPLGFCFSILRRFVT